MADKQETATSRPARNSRQTNPAVTDTLKNIHDTTRRVSTAGNSERDKKYTNNAKNTENICGTGVVFQPQVTRAHRAVPPVTRDARATSAVETGARSVPRAVAWVTESSRITSNTTLHNYQCTYLPKYCYKTQYIIHINASSTVFSQALSSCLLFTCISGQSVILRRGSVRQ